ncbi:hypothetical protein NFH98_20735 [Halomonas sp. H33-56]|uniref:phage baseplate assembly protein n=1 Tax=Halomonas sp. H33-56 TaxID=2950873 RepID=UPI0032DE9741
MTDTLTLTVGGRIYSGWTSADVTRDLEAVAGGFRIGVTDRWVGQTEPWPIRRGDPCRVAVNGEPLIDGYVDSASPSIDGQSKTLTVKGRDRTGDLVDCSAVHKPAEWHNIGLERLVRVLCEPFGLEVTLEVEVGVPFPRFAVQPGETAWEAIERACRLRAVLATGHAGGVLITRAGEQRAADDLVWGENILTARAELDMSRRYSHYTVQGQNIGTDNAWGEVAAEVEGGARDAGVPRYRPLMVMAEGTADSANAQQRAEWEAIVRAARGSTASVTVAGWTQRNGELWRPNRRVRISCEWLRLEGEMLITAVTYRQDDQSGTTATLKLQRPDALTPKPEVPEAATSGSSDDVGLNDW